MMAELTEQEEKQDEEGNLQDTILSAFVIGVIILAIWFWVFIIYLNRL